MKGMRSPLIGVAVLIAGCTLSGPPGPELTSRATPTVRVANPASVVDCGLSDLRPPAGYDASARQCLWTAYSAGMPAHWVATKYTTEGAPIPETISFDGAVVLVTRDLSLDGFSSAQDRRLWTWRCGTMIKLPWVSDPDRFSFGLSNCLGESADAGFP